MRRQDADPLAFQVDNLYLTLATSWNYKLLVAEAAKAMRVDRGLEDANAAVRIIFLRLRFQPVQDDSPLEYNTVVRLGQASSNRDLIVLNFERLCRGLILPQHELVR